MDKQKLQPRHRFFIGTITAGLFFIFSSCGVAEPTEIPVESFEALSYQPVPTDMPELVSIEGNAEIKFPPSAHEIHAYITGMGDIFVLVRFSMNASDLSEFMKSTLCNEPLTKSATPQLPSGNDFDWWSPEQAKHSEECYGEKEHSRQEIIIDMSNEEVFIVYVSTSTY